MTTEQATKPSEQWLIEAMRLDSVGESARALDLAYETIDEWLRMGNFSIVNKFLRETDVEFVPSRLLSAILTVTSPASVHLPSRQAFCDRAWETMKSRKT
jgi:hypothetical protein